MADRLKKQINDVAGGGFFTDQKLLAEPKSLERILGADPKEEDAGPLPSIPEKKEDTKAKDPEAKQAVGKIIKKAMKNKTDIKPTKPVKTSDSDKSKKPDKEPLTYLQKRRNQLAVRRQKMLDIYQDNKDTRAWAEIAESFGQALTQWAAAKQGLKDNVDLSGLKFAKTDWVAKGDAALKELDMRMDEISKESSSIDRKEERDDTQKFNDLQRKAREEFTGEQKKLDRAHQMAQTRLRTATASGDRAEREAAKRDMNRAKGIDRLMKERAANLRMEFDDINKDLDSVLSTEGTFFDDNDAAKSAVKKSLTRLRNVSHGSPKAETLIKKLEDKLKNKGIENYSEYRDAQAEILKEAHKSAVSYDVAARLYDQRIGGSPKSTGSELGEGERYARDANGTRFVVGADGTTRKAKNQ